MFDFDTVLSTIAEMYVVHRCYIRIIILKSMFFQIVIIFGIFKLFLISFMIAFLPCLHCYISEML